MGIVFVCQNKQNSNPKFNTNPKTEPQFINKDSDLHEQIINFYQLIESKNYEEAKKVFPEANLNEYKDIIKITPSDFGKSLGGVENGNITITFKLNIEKQNRDSLGNTMQSLFNFDGTIKDIKIVRCDNNCDVFSKNGKRAIMEKTKKGFNIFITSEGKKNLIDAVIEKENGIGVEFRGFYFSPKDNFLVYSYQYPMNFSNVIVYSLDKGKKAEILSEPLFTEDENYFFYCSQAPNMIPHHGIFDKSMNRIYSASGADDPATYYGKCFYDKDTKNITFDIRNMNSEKVYTFNIETKKDSLARSIGEEFEINIDPEPGVLDDSKTINDKNFIAVAPVMSNEFIGLSQEEKNKLLFEHSTKGNLREVRELIKAGADVNTIDPINLDTPLMAAGSNIEVIKELIKNGANLEAENRDRKTVLSLACEHGDVPTIRILIGLGADINATSKDAMTILMTASMQGNIEVVRELIKAGADVNRQTFEQERTALMYGAEYIEVVKELIEAGADVNIKDKDGKTALAYAKLYSGEDSNVVKFLKEAGAR
jgi:ankyrin repeat protein